DEEAVHGFQLVARGERLHAAPLLGEPLERALPRPEVSADQHGSPARPARPLQRGARLRAQTDAGLPSARLVRQKIAERPRERAVRLPRARRRSFTTRLAPDPG